MNTGFDDALGSLLRIAGVDKCTDACLDRIGRRPPKIIAVSVANTGGR